MKPSIRKGTTGSVLLALTLTLAACGKSDFHQMIAANCQAHNGGARNCSCIASTLDEGLSDQLKAAFPALRWPLKPDPSDREAVNGGILRSAGVDPADRQAVHSLMQEFKEQMHFLNEQSRNRCGGVL